MDPTSQEWRQSLDIGLYRDGEAKEVLIHILQSPLSRAPAPVNETGQISSYRRGFSTDILKRMLSAIGSWSSSLKYRGL